MLHIIDVT